MDSTFLIVLVILAVLLFLTKGIPAMIKSAKIEKNPSGEIKPESLKGIEAELYNSGFTKRIIPYDFLPKIEKIVAYAEGSIGIWFNYQKQIIALRQDYTNVIYIPFDKIQSIEVLEDDGYNKTGHKGVALGGILLGTSSSQELSRGLQVKILAGDMSSGINTYLLNLHEQVWGTKINKTDAIYRSKQECARSMCNEINIIINNSWSAEPKNEKEHSERDMRQCPYCSEEILATAKKCKHCGEWFENK